MSCDAATVAALMSLSVDDIDSGGPYSIEALSAGVPFLFVPVRDLAALGRATLDRGVWEKTIRNSWAPEVFLFTETEESMGREGVKNGDAILQARMFAPAMGLIEDPATGSAAAAFGGYLASRSDKKDRTLTYLVHQGVEMGRPSKLFVEVDVVGGDVRAVRVGGASVLITSGTLHTP